jgi:hypothetical protein
MSDDEDNDTDEQQSKSDKADPASSSKYDLVKILMNDWQWRHAHCWKTLQRFGLGALTVAAIPYAKSDIFQGNIYALFFPIASALIALAATALFAAEYVRCRPIETKYYEILGEDSPFRNKSQMGIWPSVGRSTIFLFIVGSTAISIANAWILLKVINVNVEPRQFEIYAIVLMCFSVLLGWLLARWSGKMIKKFCEPSPPELRPIQQNMNQAGQTHALPAQKTEASSTAAHSQQSRQPSRN